MRPGSSLGEAIGVGALVELQTAEETSFISSARAGGTEVEQDKRRFSSSRRNHRWARSSWRRSRG